METEEEGIGKGGLDGGEGRERKVMGKGSRVPHLFHPTLTTVNPLTPTVAVWV